MIEELMIRLTHTRDFKRREKHHYLLE